MASAEDPIAARTASPVPTAGSEDDTAERGSAPARSRPPIRQVVLQRGATLSGIAWSAFGPRMYLALDLLKDLNPNIENLNRVLAGQRLRLPRLGLDDVVRAERDGSYRLILDSFPSPDDAQALSGAVRARGYDVVVTPRQISNDLMLSRVEITGLPDKAAARRAWEATFGATRPVRETPMVEGTRRPRP
jgi:hypothetical protein